MRAASSAITGFPSCTAAWPAARATLVVSYPVSCSPQAWASGAFFLMLRGCLGLYPDAPRRRLKIVNPHLPAGGQRLTPERLRVGETRATGDFTCPGGACFAALPEVGGGPPA